eukprot:CAMPEP_0182417630 /NCGR_PEP_ID=MMETSP1167-20130531/2086_1 /TAXON_ID=2988 /ORGANISM="Mallomonas Sp, Strain CCMP3275" /LENGTH=203 /DNA_ID=CAMNT_0024591325 /DNA_START=144 /DNA_END=755 /DNA_ORIENTATION=+
MKLNAERHSFNDAVFIKVSTAICSALLFVNPSGASATEAQFLNALSGVIETKTIIKPVKDYFENQQYDQARTNIKFCINQLQLQKKVDSLVQNSIDYVDDPEVLDGIQEASARIVNTAIQLDSTVYTMIFIPSEGGEIPPSAEKYQKQSVGYYQTLNNDLDMLIKAGNEKQIQAASAKAEEELKTVPKFLFKDAKPPAKISFD